MIVTKEQLTARLEDGRWHQCSPGVYDWFGSDSAYTVEFKLFGQPDWVRAWPGPWLPRLRCRVRKLLPSGVHARSAPTPGAAMQSAPLQPLPVERSKNTLELTKRERRLLEDIQEAAAAVTRMAESFAGDPRFFRNNLHSIYAQSAQLGKAAAELIGRIDQRTDC